MSLEGSVKLEPEWESESEPATAPLYNVVKEELDLGPELLQPPDVVYALQDIVKTEPKDQTYEFQLHHENQESLEISLEEIEIKEEVKTEEEENENTSRLNMSSNADIREISSVNLASSTEIVRLEAEQKTVYEFVAQSINDCKFCSGTFDTKLLLQEHEKNQHGVKYFTCSTLTQNGKLKVELDTENKLDECKTTFATSSNLGDHLGTHTGEKPFKCNICDSAFARIRYLRIHLRTHAGEKPFKCNKCSSAFISHSKLRIHLRTQTHTGEKPFKCCLCSSLFSRPSHLRAHLRTHTGEKPFKCSQCSFSFNESSKLRTHLRTHTGEKPFKCNVCDYRATRSGGLKSHIMSRHSGQKPYGCYACSYRGPTNDHLRKHVKYKH